VPNEATEEKRRDDILSRFTAQIEESNKARAEAARDLAKAEGKTTEVVSKFFNNELVHFEVLCSRLDAVQATVASQNVVLAEIENEQRLLREFYQAEAERTGRAIQDRMQRSEDLVLQVGAEIAQTRKVNETLTMALQSLIQQIGALRGEG